MLGNRKDSILHYVINSYIKRMQPISSKSLASDLKERISAATIRNEMAELERLGYITHPHTSAGRIPTDKGYRYYVDHLVEKERISEKDIRFIHQQLGEKIKSLDELIERTSSIVSVISEEACIAVLFRPNSFCLKSVNLIPIDEFRLLIVWVTTTGIIKNAVIQINEPLNDEYIKRLSNFLNSELIGLPLEDVQYHIMRKLQGERDSLHQLYEWAQRIIEQSFGNQEREQRLCMEGLNLMLRKPDFSDIEKTRRIVEILGKKNELLGFFAKRIVNPMTVSIGSENTNCDLADCSIVSACYAFHDHAIGTINVVGSKRIRYGRIIALVEYMSHIMTEIVNQLEG